MGLRFDTLGPSVRWDARLALIAASTVLFTLAFEPYGQPWAAWVALVPLLLVVGQARTLPATFAWGWLAGALFFTANMWWLWTATIPGTAALVCYFALYWGLAAALIRFLGLAASEGPAAKQGGCGIGVSPVHLQSLASDPKWHAPVRVTMIAVVWVGCEWLRGNVARGFPWLFVGYSQSSLSAMCQISDTVGVFGVSFWVALVNGLVLVAIRNWGQWRTVATATGWVVIVLAGVAGYGAWRLAENVAAPGPRVMVVQPNHPHLPGGARTVSREDAVTFHLAATRAGLAREPADLVVWSETVAPPLNAEAREALRGTPGGEAIEQTDRQLGELTREFHVSLVTGANHVGGWRREGNARVGTEIRNSVYLYGPDGRQSEHRYDKTQLVLFAEVVPFRGVSWLHRLMFGLAPAVAAQPLVAGDTSQDPIFRLDAGPAKAWRFVAPICLENIDADTIARMCRDPLGRGKRVDFLVNVSNDGWFHPVERAQHLQNVVFRAIENRVPIARAANTGISGFVDSAGRLVRTLPAGTEGTLTARLILDSRSTFYSRQGDLFAKTCVLVTCIAAVVRLARSRRRLRSQGGRDQAEAG